MSTRGPFLTDTYNETSKFCPTDDSVYIYSDSNEDRSDHYKNWITNSNNVLLLNIKTCQKSTATFIFEGNEITVSLRNSYAFEEFWNKINRNIWYLDVTGLPHHVWAPILKSLLEIRKNTVMAMYAEPKEYSRNTVPTEGQIYDLSEKITGLSPLPGFASLKETAQNKFIFVPLLGFEGVRFSYLLEQVQPGNKKIIPIVGVPGFQIHYPFETYLGNRKPLEDTGCWKQLHLTPANCPFSLFDNLSKINSMYPGILIKIAPIGTKPHAIGAILFKLSAMDNVEIVYDHPIRKSGRSKGINKLHIYHLSSFV